MTTSRAPTEAPRLRHRPLHRADLPECIALLPPWLGFDAAQQRAAQSLWERFVDHPAVLCGVQEDLARPIGQRVQSCPCRAFE